MKRGLERAESIDQDVLDGLLHPRGVLALAVVAVEIADIFLAEATLNVAGDFVLSFVSW